MSLGKPLLLNLALGLALLAGCAGDDNGGGQATYTVGGTVSGLDGSLTLQNNGGDDLTLSGDGAFSFATQLPEGAAYAAAIKERPVHQNCAVSRGGGLMPAGDVSNISVDCSDKTWTHPATVAEDITLDGNYSFNEQTYAGAIDAQGNALVAWRQQDAQFNTHLYLREYRNGAWTAPADSGDFISPGTNAEAPQIAMADNGEAAIAWIGSVFLSEYRNGQWLHPADEDAEISPDGSSANTVKVAMDDDGDTLVVWEQNDGTQGCHSATGCRHIFLSEYRNGQWTHPADFDDAINPPGTSAFSPSLAINSAGDEALIVWIQHDGTANCPSQGCNQLMMSEYRNGRWTHPASVDEHINPAATTQAENVNQADVALSDDGQAIIAWGQGEGVFISQRQNGLWTHPQDLDDAVNPDPSIPFTYGIMADMDAQGNALVVWSQRDGTTDCFNGDPCGQIFLSEYRNGVWKHPADLADNISPDGMYAANPEVAMDDRGQALIVWSQEDVPANCPAIPCRHVYLSEYRKGAWTHPAGLDDYISPAGLSTESIILPAMSDGGDAIIVWSTRASGADPSHIFVSEFR